MPGNLIPASPTTVMPARLARSFHEELRLECDINTYPDGASDRQALALNNRRYFTVQVMLPPAEWHDLRQFLFDHQGLPFYFYNLRETVPPFSWDPTGGDPIGRYTVVFDGVWSETYTRDRAQVTGGVFQGFGATVNFALREIT
jgi:hypothetical protein